MSDKISNLKVGDGATVFGYSDCRACTVIASSPKSVTVRRDTATRLTKPEFIVGGFAGHCTNNNEIEYSYEPNPNGSVSTFTLRKNGRWVEKGYPMNNRGGIGVGRREFYDYNF